jgi:hypothetical protein
LNDANSIIIIIIIIDNNEPYRNNFVEELEAVIALLFDVVFVVVVVVVVVIVDSVIELFVIIGGGCCPLVVPLALSLVDITFIVMDLFNIEMGSILELILQQSIKLIQGNSKIDPSEARISWQSYDSSIFAWVKLLEFSLKRCAQR